MHLARAGASPTDLVMLDINGFHRAFRRFLGRRARIRTRGPLPGATSEDAPRGVTGELVAADDADVTVAAAGGIVSIPYAEIRRSNLVGD